MTRKSKRLASLVMCLLTLIAVVIGTDVVLWRTVDQGKTPIRALVLGDQDYYLLRVHAALLSGGPIESPFFWEHRAGQRRFQVFETFVAGFLGALTPLIGANAVVWANLLRALTISGLFLGLYYVFRRWAGVKPFPAMVFALAINLWQEPFAMHVQYALGSWFMPIALLGVILAVSGFAAANRPRRLGFMLLSLPAFAVHPIIFFTAGAAVGLVWLMRLRRQWTWPTFAEAAVWGAAAAALGWSLFGSFLLPDPGRAAAAAETLVRNAAIATHLPVMPLSIVRALSVMVLIVVCRRRARATPPVPSLDKEGVIWDFLLAWSVASFIGLSANLLTGNYFLGDHFLFFERILSVIAAACALRLSVTAPTKKERLAIILALIGLAAYGIGWLVGHHPRSWLVFGFAVPYFVANAVLTWTALGKPILPLLRLRFTSAGAALLIGISLLYAATFLWRLNRGFVAAHRELQTARPLFETLDRLPTGGALSNPALSGPIAMYTRQRPYWTPRAFLDEASNEELRTRWSDALVFFAPDPSMSDAAAKAGLYGAENQFCAGLSERALYQPLKRAGILRRTLCRETLPGADWNAFVERGTAEAAGRRETAGWEPSYRLDYLVIDRAAGESLPVAFTDMFELLNDDGRFAVHRYRRP